MSLPSFWTSPYFFGQVESFVQAWWKFYVEVSSMVEDCIWVKVFKNVPSKICGKQPLKNLNWYGLPTILLQSFKKLSSTNFLWSILEYLDTYKGFGEEARSQKKTKNIQITSLRF